MEQKNSLDYVLVHIGNELYYHRHSNRLKLTAVGNEVGVSHAVISRVENGRYGSLTIALLQKLADFYKVPISSLLPETP